jgi:hypothetical protein
MPPTNQTLSTCRKTQTLSAAQKKRILGFSQQDNPKTQSLNRPTSKLQTEAAKSKNKATSEVLPLLPSRPSDVHMRKNSQTLNRPKQQTEVLPLLASRPSYVLPHLSKWFSAFATSKELTFSELRLCSVLCGAPAPCCV